MLEALDQPPIIERVGGGDELAEGSVRAGVHESFHSSIYVAMAARKLAQRGH